MAAVSSRMTILVAPLAALGLAAVVLLPAYTPEDGRLTVWAALTGVTVCVVAAAGVRAAKAALSGPGRSRWAAPPAFLTLSSSLFLLMAETSAGRWSLVALTVLLVAVYFENLRGAAESHKGGTGALARLSGVLDAISLFFALAFIFGLANFYYVSLPAAALTVGLAGAALFHETLWRAGFETKGQRTLVAAAGCVCAEAYAALSFLPTSNLVNAAVAVVLLAAALRVSERVLSGAGEFKFFSRELAASLALAMVLLLTARWI